MMKGRDREMKCIKQLGKLEIPHKSEYPSGKLCEWWREKEEKLMEFSNEGRGDVEISRETWLF